MEKSFNKAGSGIKKLLLSFLLIFVFASYAIYRHTGSNSAVNMPVNTIPQLQQPSALFLKDGSYTGNVADAYYGNIQVRALIQNSKITDVQFLDYPRDRQTSIEINTRAMSLLKSEAIQAQNVNVDIVSGATETSRAFIESLTSALSRAKN